MTLGAESAPPAASHTDVTLEKVGIAPALHEKRNVLVPAIRFATTFVPVDGVLQVEQLLAPAVEYLPLAQGAQYLGDELPTVEFAVPAGQDKHVTWPAVVVYEPAAQGTQLPKGPLTWPAGHKLSGIAKNSDLKPEGGVVPYE